MAIRDIFKKNNKAPKKGKEKVFGQKNETKKAAVVSAKSEKASVAPNRTKELDRIYRILRNPHITEKATILAEGNQYIFKVCSDTNKTEVKKAVEDYYGVDVLRVRMINIPKRIRRRGKGFSIKKGYKKAIVSLPQEQKIEVLPR